MNSAYILTGATGFLGSHLMAGLLLRGCRVIVLGRAAGAEPLAARLERLLRWHGVAALHAQLTSVEADLGHPCLGLSADDYLRLCESAGEVIHCASDTSFSESRRERVLAANVAGLAAILQLAADSGTPAFHYISTAYASGCQDGACLEEPVTATHFTNAYEESKALAETVVTRRCEREGIPWTVLRPSIVYGDSVTGRALRFNALYYPVKCLKKIRDLLLGDPGLQERLGSSFRAEAEPQGGLHMPITLRLPRPGCLNLISADFFTATALTIIERAKGGGFFHIVSDQPTALGELVGFTERYLSLRGIELQYGVAPAARARNPVEELLDGFLQPYLPYLSDGRLFDNARARQVTGPIGAPRLTYEAFRRCMDYAATVAWGRSLFVEIAPARTPGSSLHEREEARG